MRRLSAGLCSTAMRSIAWHAMRLRFEHPSCRGLCSSAGAEGSRVSSW